VVVAAVVVAAVAAVAAEVTLDLMISPPVETD